MSDDRDVDGLTDQSSFDSDGEAFETPKHVRTRERDAVPRLISHTAFDAYFTQTASSSKTSSNIFSSILLPLSPDEYATALQSCDRQTKYSVASPDLTASFHRFLYELEESFNIVCYGFGSKRTLLNQFARDFCSKRGHVVVANGFKPDFNLGDFFNAIEKVPGVTSLPIPSVGIDGRAQRISNFFSQSTQKRPLYIIVHNIDGPTLRTAKSKHVIALLSRSAHVHVVASVDHIASPLLWSSRSLDLELSDHSNRSWLWHDLTTLSSYDTELDHADRSSISGVQSSRAKGPLDGVANSIGAAAGVPGGLTDTAAEHVLASVTQKARKLFVLMGSKQLENMEDSATGDSSVAIAYDILFGLARDNFIVSNDTALRSLLGEFRDHGLILGITGGLSAGEVLWISLRKERLSKILRNLAKDHS